MVILQLQQQKFSDFAVGKSVPAWPSCSTSPQSNNFLKVLEIVWSWILVDCASISLQCAGQKFSDFAVGGSVLA